MIERFLRIKTANHTQVMLMLVMLEVAVMLMLMEMLLMRETVNDDNGDGRLVDD